MKAGMKDKLDLRSAYIRKEEKNLLMSSRWQKEAASFSQKYQMTVLYREQRYGEDQKNPGRELHGTPDTGVKDHAVEQ